GSFSLSRLVCDRMAATSPGRADRAPGRCRAGGGLLGGKDPARRFSSPDRLRETPRPASYASLPEFRSSLFLLIDLQQLLCFRAEVRQFVVPWRVLAHPLHGALVPSPGLVPVAQLPVGHGQEQPVHAVTALPELHGPGQLVDGGLPV